MTTWNEAAHPRDDIGRFTYKGGSTNTTSSNNKDYENDYTDNDDSYTNEEYDFDNVGLGTTPVLKGAVSYDRNLDDITDSKEISPQINDEHDFYTQDLIKEIKNTEIEIDGIGTIKADDLIPNIEDYIEDNRTIDEKRADILYTTMKTEHPIVTDLKLLGKMFPYFVERLNIELEAKGKEKITGVEVMDSFEWEIAKRNVLTALKQSPKIIKNLDEVKAATNIEKFLKYMEGNSENPTEEELKRREDLKEMIDDFINGGDLSLYLASHPKIGDIPDAAGLLRINGNYSDLNTDYTLKAFKYDNAYQLLEKCRNIIIEKLLSQNLKINSKGLYFKSDSELSKRIAATPQLIDKIKEHKSQIKLFCDYNSSNEPITLYPKISIEYKLSQNRNLYYAFHNADIHNLKYDIFGNISGDLVDTTDFNEGKDEPILVQKSKRTSR